MERGVHLLRTFKYTLHFRTITVPIPLPST